MIIQNISRDIYKWKDFINYVLLIINNLQSTSFNTIELAKGLLASKYIFSYIRRNRIKLVLYLIYIY